MADKTLRGAIDFYTAAGGVVVGVAPNLDLPAGWTAMAASISPRTGSPCLTAKHRRRNGAKRNRRHR